MASVQWDSILRRFFLLAGGGFLLMGGWILLSKPPAGPSGLDRVSLRPSSSNSGPPPVKAGPGEIFVTADQLAILPLQKPLAEGDSGLLLDVWGGKACLLGRYLLKSLSGAGVLLAGPPLPAKHPMVHLARLRGGLVQKAFVPLQAEALTESGGPWIPCRRWMEVAP